MNWEEYKANHLTALSKEEVSRIELVSDLIMRRRELGLTQEQLAELSGLKQSAVARFESVTTDSFPRLDTVEKISKALGLKLILVEDK
ncbi:helix-turn-helix domain-containing protein [Bacillus cereus]|uniref:helix-turn-helix domain-containing protein n=1 Tax=Bacillus cereus TaxID=1396 RepID=UPI003D1757D7